MMKWLVLCLIIASFLTLAAEAQRGRKIVVRKKGKGQKHVDRNKGKGKSGMKMKQDACTAAGHPCMTGQECIVERYTGQERCICVEHCPYYPDAEVCGSDMKTYATGCHLYKHACDNHRMIFPVSFGSCDKMQKTHLKVVPEMAEACLNSHTTFRCQFDSMVEGIIEWRRGEEEISESTDKYEVQDNMLTVKHIIASDAGNYSCVTVDTNGTVRTANATLKLTQAPYADIPSDHISCEHGDRVMIPCLHSENSQVTWMKNGFEVDESDGVKVDDAGMLILPQTEFEAAGTYQCVVTNFCGAASSQCEVEVRERDPDKCEDSVTLVEGCDDMCDGMTCASIPELECRVSKCGECGYYWVDEKMRNTTCPELQAPTITNFQSVSLTSEGEDAIMECRAEGYPKPTITWRHENGSSIEDLRKHSLRGDSILVIRQLKLGVDNGRYICTAENALGSAEFTFVAAILPRMTPMCPQTTDTEMDCEVDYCATAECPAYEGSSEKLSCFNTGCNVCTYIFVDKNNQYVDCYSDPKLVKKMQQMNSMGGMSNMPGWPASSSMGGMSNMPGWPASSSMGGMSNMPGWPASSSMGGNMMGGMGNMGMSAMDKNAWHFVPGWPGHMSQMNSGGKSASSKDKKSGEESGHLNVFYSGDPDEDKESDENEDVREVSYSMGH